MKKKSIYFAITMLVAITIAFCSCSQKCVQSPQQEYWDSRGMSKE